MDINFTKRMYRSNSDRVLAGVCGGLGEYFAIDSVIIRLLWTFITVFTGFAPGIVVYIFAAFIMPTKPVQSPPVSSVPAE